MSRLWVLVVVGVAVVVSCHSAEEVRKAADEMVGETSARVEETKDTAETWTEWAKEKIQEGLGFKHNEDAGDRAKRAAADAVKSGRDTIQETVSGAGQYTADKAGEAKDKAYQTSADTANKASGKAQQAKETAYEASQDAADKAQIVKDKAKQQAQEASNKAAGIKDKAQQQAQKTAQKAEDAKETMAQKVEDAKETVSRKADEAKETATQWGKKVVDEGKKKGAEAEGNLNWAKEKAKEGYDASAKEKASDTLHTAKEKISGSSRGEEL